MQVIPIETVPLKLARAVDAVVSSDPTTADEVLEEISFKRDLKFAPPLARPRTSVQTVSGESVDLPENRTGASKEASDPRRNPAPAVHAEVFCNDGFKCRYCGVPIIPFPMLNLISAIWPSQFPHHGHGKVGECHIAYLTIAGSLEHAVAGTKGGDWLDSDNLISACWSCNLSKSDRSIDELGWLVLEPVRDDWHGLVDRYAELLTVAQTRYADESHRRLVDAQKNPPTEARHEKWIKAFTAAST